MLERAIAFQPPRIAPDEAQNEAAPASASARLRASRQYVLRGMKQALRFLSRLAEAGGPLS